MEKIAIIGANDSIVPLILKAKEKGYETHVFAWKSGAAGESIADVFYPISITEKEQILEECRKIGIAGVASVTSDFAVPTVNYIARNLGLTGNSERTDLVARNKYQMRCALHDAGLFTPPFMEAGEDFTLVDAPDFGYPLIVKPTDRWSSKGVTRVDGSEQLEDAVRRAVNESFDHKAIIEGFMDGPEYSAECISCHGDHWVLAFTKKETTGYPNYIETGHIQPSDIPAEKQGQIRDYICRALDALDIRNGAAHAEFRILEDGKIGIIEIGARMGGDCIGTDLTPIATGIDFTGMVVDIACGKEPSFEKICDPAPVHIHFIITREDREAYDKLVQEHPEQIVKSGEFNMDFDHAVVDSSTRHGFYITKGAPFSFAPQK